MIHAHIDEKRSVPLWAVLGVPVLGIPLMVALVALVASADATSPGIDTLDSREEVVAVAVDRSLTPSNGCEATDEWRS